MPDEQTTIYTARSAHLAHLLKNSLADAGIEATVTNDRPEQGMAVGNVGWAMPTVIVGRADAQRARTIVAEFDAVQARLAVRGPADASAASEPPPEPTGEVIDEWPLCPGCGQRRSTRCPVCQTAGTDFHQADMGFDWIPRTGDVIGVTPCCGPNGCTPGGCSTDEAAERPAAGDDPEADDEPDESLLPPLMLMCHTCDEPFLPEFPRQCEWCDHRFADGFEVEPINDDPTVQFDGRAIAVVFGLLALVLVLVLYFMYVM